MKAIVDDISYGSSILRVKPNYHGLAKLDAHLPLSYLTHNLYVGTVVTGVRILEDDCPLLQNSEASKVIQSLERIRGDQGAVSGRILEHLLSLSLCSVGLHILY